MTADRAPRRILFVGQTGELGGAELVLLDIVRHFRDRCGVALMADGPLRGRLAELGVTATVVAGGSGLMQVRREGGRLQSLGAIPALVSVVRRLAALARGYDVLYPNSQKAAVATMLAGALARRPVVWHLHDILSPEHFAVLQRRGVVALSNRLATRVITNSAAARAAYIQSGGDAGKVGVVLNGIDPEAFDRVSDAEAEALRDSLGLRDVRLVGLFGRLSPWKGQRTLVQALPKLPGVHALIVGDALFGEQDYKAALLREAAATGIADRIHWLGFRNDVPALMRAVDVVLHTSTAPEPFGRVVVEAMLARRPLLASRDGAVMEVLGEDSPELVVPGDPAALAAAIARVLAAPAPVREARVMENDRRARALFSAGRMMADLEKELALAV